MTIATIRRIGLSGAAALGLALAALPASAQPQGPYAEEPDNGSQVTVYGAPDEGVIVVAPHYPPQRSAIGAPIVDVSIARTIHMRDADLRTAWGAHVLRVRIRRLARRLCDRLDTRFPVTADGSPPCYRNAVRDAMYQADRAIANARGYTDED